MIRQKRVARRRSGRGNSRIGIALAGGGPLGGMYEIGALCALEEAVESFDACGAARYCGVSVGALLSAGLVAGLPPRRMARLMFRHDPKIATLDPSIYARPAVRRTLRRMARLPRVLAETAWRTAVNSEARNATSILLGLGAGLPSAAFESEPIREWIATVLDAQGLADDLDVLAERLTIVATELESGEPALFGRGDLRDVPISLAVQASASVPGLYPPVSHNGRNYVDGALAPTMHASVLLDDRVDLLIALNPLVPVNLTAPRGGAARGSLADAGIPALLSQSVRVMLHSRMKTAHAHYATRYPRTDVLLLEPTPFDYELFFADPFALENRQTICELGYRATLRFLRANRLPVRSVLARHGLRLRDELLEPGAADFWRSVDLRPPRRSPSVVRRLSDSLDRVEARVRTGALKATGTR